MFKASELRFFYAIDVKSYECDIVYRKFKDFCRIYGFNYYRQDEHGLIGDIEKQIFDKIEKSQYFVADVSTRNPNVMLELGYAFKHLGKERVIIFHQESEQKPIFDIISQHTVFYDLGTDLEQKKSALDIITKKLLYWFRENSENRRGLILEGGGENVEYEDVFHFPSENPDENPNFQWRPESNQPLSDGGQRLNEYGNIVVCHKEISGNFNNRNLPRDKNSYMTLIRREKTKQLIKKGDKLHLRVRACLRNADHCKFTFLCDGNWIEVNGNRTFFWGHEWTQSQFYSRKDKDGQPLYQIVGDGSFDIKVEPFYEESPGVRKQIDENIIEKYGLGIGLGTTIEQGEVEISEIILVRERAKS